MRRLLPVLVAVALVCASTSTANARVPRLIFPVVGAVSYSDDFGQMRAGGPHQGNDLLADKRAPAVAVEAGTVEFWTTSASAGCMLYLHGVSGTSYQYIHLNNDLTSGNDNKGKCVAGVSYANGLVDGQHVEAGEIIGYVGDSGDANGLHAHLHFEVHPRGGKAVDPTPFLKKATHLLVAAPPAGSTFTLKLTGTVMSATGTELSLVVGSLASWPSHLKQTKLNRLVTIAVAASTTVDGDLVSALPGQKVVVWTLAAPGTFAAISGAPDALSADRILLEP
jgi:hypothetical protein